MKLLELIGLSTLAVLVNGAPASNGGSTKNNVQWWIKKYDYSLDKAAMHTCLEHFNTGSFQNQYWCGGMYWQMGSRYYNSPSDCYAACHWDMAAGIDQGASDQECDDYEGSAECWFQMWKA